MRISLDSIPELNTRALKNIFVKFSASLPLIFKLPPGLEPINWIQNLRVNWYELKYSFCP